jgi:hypothetical protein
VTTRAERDRALSQGATGIITDDPRYLTGQTDRYPLVPTRIRIRQRPRTTQVSDPVSAVVQVMGESGPGIPGISPSVHGRSVTATSTPSTSVGLSRLRLDTVGARAGSEPVSVRVAAGSGGERRWDSGSRGLQLPLAREDLQLGVSAVEDGSRVRFRLRLLDSAAGAYTGARRETGRGATVAGLTRAGLRLTVRNAGRVVHRVDLVGRDTGVDDGDSTMWHGWTAPGRGTYELRVVQHGRTYAGVSVSRRFTVR